MVSTVHPGRLASRAQRPEAEQADSGAVTLIQRFGSAANLNIHLYEFARVLTDVQTVEELNEARTAPPTRADVEYV